MMLLLEKSLRFKVGTAYDFPEPSLPSCIRVLTVTRTSQPRLETLPSRDACVHVIPAKEAAQRRIREAPLPSVEAVTLVNEAGCEFAFAAALPERCLATICVTSPVVEGQY